MKIKSVRKGLEIKLGIRGKVKISTAFSTAFKLIFLCRGKN